MKKSLKPRQLPVPKLNFLEWNAQLFREVKGKFKPRNIILTVGVSVITQAVLVFYFLGKLPEPITNIGAQYSPYCFGTDDYHRKFLCQTDLLNNWVINWQLLWYDLFVVLSLIAIFALLIGGTYMLVADIVKEESRGTFNFIRLSPQSATTILTGKILGVPSLLYLGILLAFPLHLFAGLGARLSLGLILAFDLVVVAACAFFYSAALLVSLVNTGLSGFKPWLVGGVVTFFLSVTNAVAMNGYSIVSNNLLDWFNLFYPGRVLTYLSSATYLPENRIPYDNARELAELMFYGHPLWTTASLGIGLMLLNYGLWTYWIWEALKRRFQDPQSTLLTKTQSYWLTGWFVVVALGFTLQSTHAADLRGSLAILQAFLLCFFLVLIAALSPHRQALHDWARYRHQVKRDGRVLWKELLFGDRSPANVAIGINLLIATAYILPSIFLFPFENETVPAVWSLLLSVGTILFYSLVAQLILTIESQKRAIWSAAAVTATILLPFVALALGRVEPHTSPLAFLLTSFPFISTEYATASTLFLAILGQWTAIAIATFQMTKTLRRAGASETKLLFDKQATLKP